MAACEVGKDLFEKSLGPTMINYDNQSCIKMSGDPVFHSRIKHINNKYHLKCLFIGNLVQDGILKL